MRLRCFYIQLNVKPNKSKDVKELNINVTISTIKYQSVIHSLTITDTISHIKLSLVDDNKIHKYYILKLISIFIKNKNILPSFSFLKHEVKINKFLFFLWLHCYF